MDIIVPAVGESVVEAVVAKWNVADGAVVAKDQPLCEVETDKITFEINADTDGVVRIDVPEGSTVKIGAIIGRIEPAAADSRPEPTTKPITAPPGGPASPAVRKLAREQGVPPESISGTGKGGRVTIDDLMDSVRRREDDASHGENPEPPKTGESSPHREERVIRKPMTPIRKRIAERLLAVRQQTAMLTSFNEADLTRVLALRQKHKDDYRNRHGVSLGFMSFFVKATVAALADFPALNARIDGDDIVYHQFYDIGIAVSGEKGLVVPVLRDADRLKFFEIEAAIAAFTEKIKSNRLGISDLEGGTFTITNGGVFGSLLSTPILNPPQCGVLGMHAVQDRPVARNGEVVIRPMMYLALSYDHRLVDGREAVQFLKKLKGYIEDPEEMLLEI